MSKQQRPDDLVDFLVGLFAVSSMVFAVVCLIVLAVGA